MAPWAHLAWWESPYEAELGIRALCSLPFLHLQRNEPDDTMPGGIRDTRYIVANGCLYPDALATGRTRDDQFASAARYVSAMVRQGREFFQAATQPGVSELTAPDLFYNSALSLGRAVVASVFGAPSGYVQHGMSVEPGPSAQHTEAPWPTVVLMQAAGDFPNLYRAVRWDRLYGLPKATQRPHLHALECIRWLQYDWGSLPPRRRRATDSANVGGYRIPPIPDRSHWLLPYLKGVLPVFMTPDEWQLRPLLQLPAILVEYMLLFLFSNLARYYPVIWQQFMAGLGEPEAYVFRSAAARVPSDFVASAAFYLPRPDTGIDYIGETWLSDPPDLDAWFVSPFEAQPTQPILRFRNRSEWVP